MRRLSPEDHQIDLSARYNGTRIGLLCILYSDYGLFMNFSWGECMRVANIIILFSAVANSTFCVQYEKENLNQLTILFYFLYSFGGLIFLYVFFLIMCVIVSIFCYIYILFVILFRILRRFFIFWKPFFKKFGYLLNFFKKK